MSEYNDLFDFDAPAFAFDAVDSEYPAPPSGPGQSAAWTATLQPLVGLMGGNTTAELQLDTDPAPSVVAEPLGVPISSASQICHCQVDSVAKHACAVCLEPYQTDFALHRHAVEAQHQAYQCKCGTGFNKASALKRHIDTKNASKTFACTLCHDKFTRKDKLKDHCRHYHKVMDHGLQFLFTSWEVKPQPGAPSRRRRALTRKPVASSGHPAPILRPAHTPATAGPSDWSIAATTGQQYAGLLAGTFAPAASGAPATASAFPFPDNSSVPVGQFVTSADAFAINPALDEDILGQLEDFFGDGIQAMSFNGFN